MGPRYCLLHQLSFSSAPLRNDNTAALPGGGVSLAMPGSLVLKDFLLLLVGLGGRTAG